MKTLITIFLTTAFAVAATANGEPTEVGSKYSEKLIYSPWNLNEAQAGRRVPIRGVAYTLHISLDMLPSEYSKIRRKIWDDADPIFSRGDAVAQFERGTFELRLLYDDEALKWYRKAAEQGNLLAQYNLGVMYESGMSVKKDVAEALKWYRKAAEQGNLLAQYNLGLMYETGLGVNKDEAEAVKWYRKAAEQGNLLAQYNLGLMYETGLGVNKDEAEAVKWYRKAAEQGNAMAQNNLGVMYQDGRGVSKDEAEAVKWYRKAAGQGNASAQKNLGGLEELKKVELSKAAAVRIAGFRKNLKVESETNCGPVLEIKGTLVKVYVPVQGYGNEHWVRLAELFPADYPCRFLNGKYQPEAD